MGLRSSHRYAVHLLTLAAILAKADITERGSDSAELEPVVLLRHVQHVNSLLQGAKTFSKRLAKRHFHPVNQKTAVAAPQMGE